MSSSAFEHVLDYAGSVADVEDHRRAGVGVAEAAQDGGQLLGESFLTCAEPHCATQGGTGEACNDDRRGW